MDIAFTQIKTDDDIEKVLIPIVECGEHSILYTIPSFSVITMRLRPISYQGYGTEKQVKLVDGFMRDDPSLQEHTFPTQIMVQLHSSKACLVEASEADKSIDVSKMTLAGSVVLVIWEWEWFSEELESSSDERTEITVIPETPPPEREISDNEDDAIPEAAIPEALVSPSIAGDDISVTHTAMFKCIGCTKEVEYQEVLARASQLRTRGETVECKLKQEPDNPFDSKAIAFFCRVDEKWHKIGYAVKEVLEDLHDATESNAIIDVSIKWIKYVIYWQTPGWYAGINITRKGEWSNTVLRSQSSRM